MTWVYRDGKLVEKTYERHPARSGLPAPNVIRDGLAEPLQHMSNGRWYDSKRAMEKADREAGCVCVGNETPKPVPFEPPPITMDDVEQAYSKLEQGYKPSIPVEKIDDPKSGWT